MRRIKPKKFQKNIFLSLLITGIFQVLLISFFMIIFASKLIEDSYRNQSNKKIMLLTEKLNITLQNNIESSNRLSKSKIVLNALFNKQPESREELSTLYQILYKSISGKIDDISLHLVNRGGTRIYSTHKLPEIYDPKSPDQEISYYIRVNKNKSNISVINSILSPKGDKVILSLINVIKQKTGKEGYIITDINHGSLLQQIEDLNISFFSDIYLIDNINHKYINLLNKGEYGNFLSLQREIPKDRSGIFNYDSKIISYNTLAEENIVLVGVVEYESANTNMLSLVKLIMIISIIGFFISGFVAFLLSKKISKPVMILSQSMKKIEDGDLSIQVNYHSKDEFELLFHGFNKMSSQIQTLLNLRIEREKELHKAERQALQSQINPHFLYNTLNTVKAISKLKNIPEITTIITELGKLLRDSIDSGDEFTTINKSLILVEGYLKIQKIRFGNNFNWDIDIDTKLRNIKIPKLIIQPIVENSVVHGLEKLTGTKKISISSILSPPAIVVSDNGNGINNKDWFEAINDKNGVGLVNVHKRLKLYYGPSAGLNYYRKDNISTVVIQLSDNGYIIDNA